MEFELVLEEVIILARSQFKTKEMEILEGSTAADIPSWNSLSHVMLIAAIEKSFGIKFDLLKMVDMESIGDIARETQQVLE